MYCSGSDFGWFTECLESLQTLCISFWESQSNDKTWVKIHTKQPQRNAKVQRDKLQTQRLQRETKQIERDVKWGHRDIKPVKKIQDDYKETQRCENWPHRQKKLKLYEK